MKIFTYLLLTSALVCFSSAFVPASLLASSILVFDQFFGESFGKVSDSLTHEEITRRGIIQSAVRFFYDQPNGSVLVNLSKIDNEYRSLSVLYYDYYGRSICTTPLDVYLTITFQPNVARVDFESGTKDLPYAHFDAETFIKSNEFVTNRTNQINALLDADNYGDARALAGQVMHTIQDFYSHSNHVEMGQTTINTLIGTPQFETAQPIISKTEANACLENCELITEACTTFISVFSSILSVFGYESAITQCPLTYYNCTNNINILDKLLSGYYSGSKLEDNTPVNKPENLIKCSHGGILDASALVQAKGGINKDSGFLVFSPHAYLHTQAANLAVEHTEYYFNQIRARIGDTKYDTFMALTIDSTVLLAYSDYYSCSALKLDNKLGFLIILNMVTVVLFRVY